MASPRGNRAKSHRDGDFYIPIYMNTISDQEHVPLGKLAVCPLRSVEPGSTYTPSGNYYSKCMPVEGSEGTGKHSSPSLINFGRLFSVNIFACSRGRGLQPLPYRSVHTRLRDRSIFPTRRLPLRNLLVIRVMRLRIDGANCFLEQERFMYFNIIVISFLNCDRNFDLFLMIDIAHDEEL